MCGQRITKLQGAGNRITLCNKKLPISYKFFDFCNNYMTFTTIISASENLQFCVVDLHKIDVVKYA